MGLDPKRESTVIMWRAQFPRTRTTRSNNDTSLFWVTSGAEDEDTDEEKICTSLNDTIQLHWPVAQEKEVGVGQSYTHIFNKRHLALEDERCVYDKGEHIGISAIIGRREWASLSGKPHG
jgi:hypothetical protein